jgi:hypothetical protein
MFYTPGFLALLLIKAGEPVSFGITVELLMLSSAAAVIGGLYIGTQSADAGADRSSKVGTWSGALVVELLAVVPLLCAMPSLFNELAHSRFLHAMAPGAVEVTLGGPSCCRLLRSCRSCSTSSPASAPCTRCAEARELGHQHRHSLLNHRQLCRQPRGRVRH